MQTGCRSAEFHCWNPLLPSDDESHSMEGNITQSCNTGNNAALLFEE